jgi:hypothetical protein
MIFRSCTQYFSYQPTEEGVPSHRRADQALDQTWRQSFLSCPEVVCACGLLLSSGAPSPGGAGPGFIGLRPTKNLRTKRLLCSKSAKKINLDGNVCYPAIHRPIGVMHCGLHLQCPDHQPRGSQRRVPGLAARKVGLKTWRTAPTDWAPDPCR